MPYDKVILPWSKVAKRIGELIASGRYMSEKQLDHLPVYEKGVLAREVCSFYYNLPEDVPRPLGSPYSEYKKSIFDLVPAGGYWRDIPGYIAKEYMKSCWNMDGGERDYLGG